MSTRSASPARSVWIAARQASDAAEAARQAVGERVPADRVAQLQAESSAAETKLRRRHSRAGSETVLFSVPPGQLGPVMHRSAGELLSRALGGSRVAPPPDSWAAGWAARGSERGYSRVSDNGCPRELLDGRGCRGRGCWCGSRLNDHAATWVRLGGRARGVQVVLWEPYRIFPDELATVADGARLDGLDLMVHSNSPWSPGHSLAIEFLAGGTA